MRPDLILVTGATGNTGSAVLQELRRGGARVRAMVRAPSDQARLSDPTVETVVGNFDDPHSIESALAGVTSAYLVTPSGPDAEAQQSASQSSPRSGWNVVKLSQLAADEASPVRFLRYHAAVDDTSESSASASASCVRTSTSKGC